MILLFQLALFALIAVSFLMVVAVPVSFASPEGFAGSKGPIFTGAALWIFLVFLVGVLNSFVI
jgi:photosystem II PsbZ protein|tara:strand:- start:2312 stop:2500 length:189 start_codon:yes stop_codon:yes gene_type:complete